MGNSCKQQGGNFFAIGVFEYFALAVEKAKPKPMQIFGNKAHWVLQTYGIGPLTQQLDLMRVVNDAVDVLNSKPGADICALDMYFQPRLHYVALSRARNFEGITLANPLRCKDFERWKHVTDIAASESTYGRYGACGAPKVLGCVGSMDGVHVRYANCPAHMSAACTCKEKYPTIGWNVSASHTMRILYVRGRRIARLSKR